MEQPCVHLNQFSIKIDALRGARSKMNFETFLDALISLRDYLRSSAPSPVGASGTGPSIAPEPAPEFLAKAGEALGYDTHDLMALFSLGGGSAERQAVTDLARELERKARPAARPPDAPQGRPSDAELERVWSGGGLAASRLANVRAVADYVIRWRNEQIEKALLGREVDAEPFLEWLRTGKGEPFAKEPAPPSPSATGLGKEAVPAVHCTSCGKPMKVTIRHEDGPPSFWVSPCYPECRRPELIEKADGSLELHEDDATAKPPEPPATDERCASCGHPRIYHMLGACSVSADGLGCNCQGILDS
jgi:hypothetical protein